MGTIENNTASFAGSNAPPVSLGPSEGVACTCGAELVERGWYGSATVRCDECDLRWAVEVTEPSYRVVPMKYDADNGWRATFKRTAAAPESRIVDRMGIVRALLVAHERHNEVMDTVFATPNSHMAVATVARLLEITEWQAQFVLDRTVRQFTPEGEAQLRAEMQELEKLLPHSD